MSIDVNEDDASCTDWMVDFGQLQDFHYHRSQCSDYALQANTMATQQLHHALASSNAAGRCQVGSIVPCGRVGHSAMDKAHREWAMPCTLPEPLLNTRNPEMVATSDRLTIWSGVEGRLP
ncbi:hypothetical protein T4C_2826 [Trichinella pseudospiralis]|uniref:Uncharacterized protein n=1 Tax=Trichinella pseudospiralis TaxID=6337 RepID=A0A0V1JQ68_TRIPS|nr:hypothetical protein T4D_7348 [Trichinella pseudospiralis]KRZ37111.1 hypothetical protein T4C_2826 [Trichinella pseudospiralis]